MHFSERDFPEEFIKNRGTIKSPIENGKDTFLHHEASCLETSRATIIKVNSLNSVPRILVMEHIFYFSFLEILSIPVIGFLFT